MLSLRALVDSWRIDRGKGAAGPLAGVHRALSELPRMTPAPAGLRARVMDRVYESAPAAPVGRVHAWGRIGLAAAAAVALGSGLYVVIRPGPVTGGSSGTAMSMPAIPVDVGPVVRLVAMNVDRPLLDQAQKMMDDTRRATEAVVRCIPFARGDSRPAGR